MYSRAILLERVQLALIRAAWSIVAVLVSVWVWHRLAVGQAAIPWLIYLFPAILVALVTMVVMWGTPAIDPRSPKLGTAIGIARGILIVLVVVVLVSFFYREDTYSRGTILVFVPIGFAALSAAAVTHRTLLHWINGGGDSSRRVIVVGMGQHGQRIAATLLSQPAYYSVVGYIDDQPRFDEAPQSVPHLGVLSDLASVIEDEAVDVAMVALTDHDERASKEVIGVCMAYGVDWKVVPPMLGLLLDHIEFEYVGGLPLVGQRRSRLVGYNWYVKRAFDLTVAGFMLVFLSPVLAIAWVAIRVTSRGPAVFRQERIGLHGRPFTLLKLRTMGVESDSEPHQQATADWIVGKSIASDTTDGGVHKLTTDDRITSVGRVLRVTSIDELPQLWNVIRGDMSLVGPRPPIEYEVARYTERHRRRLDVPPGVTGLWQVSGRNNLSFDDMVELDISYIERWSLSLDVEILLRTIPAVVSDHGY